MTDILHAQLRSGPAPSRADTAASYRFAPVFCVLGFLATIAIFYPGLATPDSLDQFQQGLTGHYTDWHPPVMALLWSLLDKVWIGPQPMLLLQAGGYWLAVYLLLATLPPLTPKARWVAAFAVLFFLKFSGLATLQPSRGFWTTEIPTAGFGFVVHQHALFYALKAYVYAGLVTPFLRVVFWLAASGALAVWALRRTSHTPAIDFAAMAGLLSCLYVLSYVPFGLAPDFRYIHLAIVLTTFGAVAVAAPLLEAVQANWLSASWTRRSFTIGGRAQ